MCGRFDIDASEREFRELLDRLPPGSPPVKTGEIYPGDTALALIQDERSIAPRAFAWGFPRWDGKGLVFNARSETATQKRLFAPSLKKRPLAVPASGFYEWRDKNGKKEKFLFTNPQSSILYMAGFWDVFANREPRFVILTTEANPSMSPYHPRMPLLLAQDELLPWLSSEGREKILAETPYPVKAEARP